MSRVLNERPGVSPQARRQVLTAIDVLGYDRPVRLRPRAGGLVGLVMPELENPFFRRLAHHLEIALSRTGLSPVLCSQTLGGVHEDDYVAILLEHSVAGIVFVSGVHALVDSDPARYQRLMDLGLPIVLVNGALTGLRAPSVSTDDTAAVDLAVQHLEHMGHRRIGAALGQLRYLPAQRRRRAFIDALTSRGLVPADLGVEDLVEATSLHRPGRPAGCGAAARPWRHRHRVRVGRDGAGRRAQRADARPPRPRGRLGGRLRRQPDDGVRRPAAHDGAPARRGPGPGREPGDRRADRRGRHPTTARCSTGPSSWCGDRPRGRPGPAERATAQPRAATISLTLSLASPKSIWVFSLKNSGFCTPA